MTREEEIRARFNTLPYATDDMKALESCCGSEGGTGIMDDFGHRIADEVLEPYLQFFIEAPDDIDYLLKENEGLWEQVSVLSETYQDSRLLYEVTISENRRLRDGIIRLHEFTKFVPITDGEDEDPEEQALAFLNKLFDIQKMARELRQSLDGAE